MMELSKAIKKIHETIPNVLIYGCGENEECYLFDTYPRKTSGTDRPIGDMKSYVVWQETGTIEPLSSELMLNDNFKASILDDYPTKIDYCEMDERIAPISKKNIVKSWNNEGNDGEIIGYEYNEEAQIIIPLFRLPEDPHDIPTDGGTYYYDMKKEKWKWMSLLECCEYTGFKTVSFEDC